MSKEQRRPSVSQQVAALEVDDANRKQLRHDLYVGIFQKYRKTILVMGSFLRMLRKGDSSYAAIK